MKTIPLSLVLVGMMLIPRAALAQAPRTWVAALGDDANPCSRTAPCKTFAGAISKTAALGTISVVDSSGYGAVTIRKSISIIAEGVQASILGNGTNGINVDAGSNDVIYIRGLVIEGGTTGLSGIRVLSAQEVHVENCLITGFQAVSGYGIAFEPTVTSTLFVSDTTVSDNGKGTDGGGIHIAPGAGGSAVAVIDRVRAHANGGFGIKADSSTGAINMTVRDAVFAGHSAGAGIGVLSPVGGNMAFAMLDRTASVQNQLGIEADGAAAGVQISNLTVTSNVTGLAAANGGQILSYGNNSVGGNGTDGAPTGAIAPK